MKKKKKKGYSTPCIFMIIGILFLAGGVFWFKYCFDFKESAVQIYGEISKIESYRDSDDEIHNTVFVTYEYDGNIYKDVRINSYSSSMTKGKRISLYCDPNDPWRVQASFTLYLRPAMMAGTGLIFTIVGAGIFVSMTIKGAKQKKLREKGKSIYATVEQITCNTKLSKNGAHPYVIYCTYRDRYTDVTYRFKSETLWYDPSAQFPVGSTIEVKVDEKDYSRHYVKVEGTDGKVIDYT